MIVRYKGCYCYTCDQDYHYLGIARHRAMHRDRLEDCKIMFSDGTVKRYRYGTNALEQALAFDKGSQPNLTVRSTSNE